MDLWTEVGQTFLAFTVPFLAAIGLFGAFRVWQVFIKKN